MAFRSNSPLVFRVTGEDADRPFCRICLESGPPEDFFKPCRCRGSAIGIHPACLQTWIQNAPTERAKTHCTVCDTEYVLSPPMKHSLTNFCRLIHHNSVLTGIMLISVSATAAIPMPYHPYIFGAGIFCFLTWLFLIHIFCHIFHLPPTSEQNSLAGVSREHCRSFPRFDLRRMLDYFVRSISRTSSCRIIGLSGNLFPLRLHVDALRR